MVKKTTTKSDPVTEPYVAPAYQTPPSQNNPTNIILMIVVIILAVVSTHYWTKAKTLEDASKAAPAAAAQAGQQPPDVQVTQSQIKALFSNGALKFGNTNSKLLFVEISDPSCPYCHIAGGFNGELAKQVGSQFQYVADGGSYVAPVPEIKKLVDQGKAAFVMIYANGHGNGELAMQALYCANDKGKFWEVNDKLMTMDGYNLLNTTVKNDKTKIPELVSFLSGQMDSNYLSDCLTNGKYAANLQKDQKIALDLGFSGTPHFFVNTTAFKGAYGFADMQSAVDAALK